MLKNYNTKKIYIHIFVVKIICLYHSVQIASSTEYNKHTQAESDGCILPQHPNLGRWQIRDKIDSNTLPGEIVSSGTLLEISCQENHKLDGESTTICMGKNWKNKIGRCLRTCPTIISTSILKVTCIRKGKMLESCTNPMEATRVQFNCTNFYETKDQETGSYVCSSGAWFGSLPTCVPVCGKVPEDLHRIVGGKNVTEGQYPWQAAVYRISDHELICGGTILNQKMILTAAHCVTDADGNVEPKAKFIIAVGKHYRQYNHSSDAKKAQFSSVQEMHIPRQYKADTQNYFGDIALIITDKIFNISKHVQPVCVNRNPNDYKNISKKHSFVSGWGFTREYKDPSAVLKYLQVPVVDDEECNDKLPPDFREYMTDDKICDGFLNSSTSICRGDSGGGLVSEMDNRFYIIGVVSVSPVANSNLGGCDSQQYALYTKFWYYLQDFILDIEERIKSVNCNDPSCKSLPLVTKRIGEDVSTPSTIGCTGYCSVPNRPIFATWKAFVGEEFSPVPGIMVPSGTILRINCTEGSTLVGESTTTCIGGKWSFNIGQCVENCLSLTNTSTTLVTCIYKNKTLENCEDSPHGTLASISCAPYYTTPEISHVCHDGRWNRPMPECEPLCGMQKVELPGIWSKPTPKNVGNYPWHVGIYTTKDKKLICSGTLVRESQFVQTVSPCVRNSEGELFEAGEIIVAAGKIYREFNDSRDQNAQYSEVSSWGLDTHKPSDYLTGMEIFLDNLSKCLNNQTEDIDSLAFIKFCGRNDNETSACDVDSGSGLLQKVDGKYYIVGVASTFLKDECENHRYRWYSKTVL